MTDFLASFYKSFFSSHLLLIYSLFVYGYIWFLHFRNSAKILFSLLYSSFCFLFIHGSVVVIVTRGFFLSLSLSFLALSIVSASVYLACFLSCFSLASFLLRSFLYFFYSTELLSFILCFLFSFFFHSVFPFFSFCCSFHFLSISISWFFL